MFSEVNLSNSVQAFGVHDTVTVATDLKSLFIGGLILWVAKPVNQNEFCQNATHAQANDISTAVTNRNQKKRDERRNCYQRISDQKNKHQGKAQHGHKDRIVASILTGKAGDIAIESPQCGQQRRQQQVQSQQQYVSFSLILFSHAYLQYRLSFSGLERSASSFSPKTSGLLQKREQFLTLGKIINLLASRLCAHLSTPCLYTVCLHATSLFVITIMSLDGMTLEAFLQTNTIQSLLPIGDFSPKSPWLYPPFTRTTLH
jgi:hypothetical protein